MKKLKGLAPCVSDKYSNCFACKNGKCACLDNTNFSYGICPFYKSCEQAKIDRSASLTSLFQRGKADLITKYKSDTFLHKGD